MRNPFTGKEGPFAELEYLVPSSSVKWVKEATVKPTPDGSGLTVVWEYPDMKDDPYFQGFRISVIDDYPEKKIVFEDELGADVRQWHTETSLKPETHYIVEMEAFQITGVVSFSRKVGELTTPKIFLKIWKLNYDSCKIITNGLILQTR